MVAPKAKPGMTQYMTDKPTKWGMKGFTLAESTFRFITYTVKTLKASDAVLCLMMWWWTFFSCCLAQDAMFTWTVVLYQSQMFLDLTSTRCGACSIYTGNAWEGGKILSTKKCELGSVRWIRDDPLDIVKWMDTWEVRGADHHPPVCPGWRERWRMQMDTGLWEGLTY